MTMWLNQYLRQDSEKERAQQQQLAMEAGVHYHQQQQQLNNYNNRGPCPASPGQAPVPTSGFDPRVQQQRHTYMDEGTSPIHDMPQMVTRLGFAVPSTIRQDSILSVVSDWESSINSPSSITMRDRYKSATDSEYLDNDLNEVKIQSPASSTENLSSHKSLKCCMFSVITVGLALFVAAFVLLFVTWHQSKRNSLFIADHSCAICDHLVLSSDPIDDHRAEFSQRMEHGVLICCATNATQFENLINYMFERKAKMDRAHNPSFSAHTSHEVSKPPPPPEGVPQRTPQLPPTVVLPDAPNTHAAHLFLNSPTPVAHGMNIVRTWSDDLDTAFVRKGVDWDKQRGRVLIKDPGTYFIYAHMVYHGPRVDSESSNSDNFLRLFQMKIKRQNTGILGNGEQILFEDTQAMRCDENLHQNACYTSTAMGQVKLRAGDEVFVEVRNGELLRQGKSSYFGLYRIE